MTTNEMKWIKRARQGDQHAFECLIGAYQRPVFNLCYRLLGDHNQAEDAAQEVFYKTYRSLKRYDLNRSFVNWILSIASHHCIDQLRRKRIAAFPWTDLVNELGKPGFSPEDKIIQQEWKENCRSLLNQLDPVDRAAIILFYWHDCSQSEIAEALNLSLSAVKSRLHRSRRRLADFIASQQTDQKLDETLEFTFGFHPCKASR